MIIRDVSTLESGDVITVTQKFGNVTQVTTGVFDKLYYCPDYLRDEIVFHGSSTHLALVGADPVIERIESARSAGRVAYETLVSRRISGVGDWAILDPTERENWHAVAAAVIEFETTE